MVWEFLDEDACSEFALKFSAEHNIVNSNEWANLCIEDGKMGGNKLKDMTPIRLAEICQHRANIQKEIWKSRSKEHQAKVTAIAWKKRSNDKKKQIASKISKTLLNRSPKELQQVKDKLREAIANRPVVTCPHCGLTRKYSGNMKKYHYDNCKKKSTV
jgi:hypothetical protein